MDPLTTEAVQAIDLREHDEIVSDDPCAWTGTVQRVTSEGGRTTVRILCEGRSIRETYDSYGEAVHIRRR